MAVLSPSLVIAMCVMFVFTRLHRHIYVFEAPFLFGLKYYLQPDQRQLSEIAQAGKSGKKKANPSKSSTSKQKVSVTDLTVRRSTINPTFFTSEAEFPYHRNLDHLMTLLCGYTAAYLFEDITKCYLPNFLQNTRSFYIAICGVGFAVVQTWRISVSLTSTNIMLVLTGSAWLVVMYLLSAGDLPDFIHFESAFQGLRGGTVDLLTDKLQIEAAKAEVYARNFSIAMRFVLSVVAAFIVATTAAPARRFSRIDFEIHRQYKMDESVQKEDPYYIGRPSAFAILVLTLDYIVPLGTAAFWCLTPRRSNDLSWRLLSILICVCIRFACMRRRLQSFLDGAIDAYRVFWTKKTTMGVIGAGREAATQIIGTSFYLIMITMAYVAPAIVPLFLTLVSKLEGAVSSGICPVEADVEITAFNVFIREIAAFLAWLSVTSYVLFAALSLCVEFALDYLYPGARDLSGKLPMPTSASERRRQKREMQEHMMRHQLQHAKTKSGKD